MRPKVNILAFAEYANTNGPGRIQLITEQRAVYEGGSLGWPTYEPMKKAIKRDFMGRESRHVASAVGAARPNQAPHFKEIWDGWERVRPPAKCGYVPMRDAEVKVGPITVVVRPSFGVRLPSGAVEVWVIYLKKEPLKLEAANLVLRTMARVMPSMHAGGVPVVVDVRRAKQCRPRRVRKGFDQWIEAEAEGYAKHWDLRMSAA